MFWGKETRWLADERHSADGQLDNPLAAVEMGLIYVNPEGPEGHPDPLASGKEVRDTFGKCRGAASADHLEAEPEAAELAEQGLGWHNRFASGKGEHTITSGIEGAWKPLPTRWDQG